MYGNEALIIEIDNDVFVSFGRGDILSNIRHYMDDHILSILSF